MVDNDRIHWAHEDANHGYGDGVFDEGRDSPNGCFETGGGLYEYVGKKGREIIGAGVQRLDVPDTNDSVDDQGPWLSDFHVQPSESHTTHRQACERGRTRLPSANQPKCERLNTDAPPKKPEEIYPALGPPWRSLIMNVTIQPSTPHQIST